MKRHIDSISSLDESAAAIDSSLCGSDQKAPRVLCPISCAVSFKGERESLEDAHVRIDNFKLSDLDGSLHGLECASYYCVCDGHAGARAAEFATNTLHKKLAAFILTWPCNSTLVEVEKDVKRFFIEAYKSTDEEFIKRASEQRPPWKDGTTVVSVLMLNRTLYVSNVGDSRAVLFRVRREQASAQTEDQSKINEKDKTYQAIQLTRDHTAAAYEERQRIHKAGGFVKDGRVGGVVEVSRSIGDGPYKHLGLTCLPDVRRLQFISDDHFIILACDGVWKVLSLEETAMAVSSLVSKEPIADKMSVAEAIARDLAASALRKLSGDNVTVIAVDIRPITESISLAK